MTYSKLNLGSGHKPLNDYLNVDLSRSEGVNLIADIQHLTFKEESFNEILLQDVLEHFSLYEAKIILRNCYQWQKLGGEIRVYVPNIRLLAYNLSVRDCPESLKWMYGSDGTKTSSANMFHRWGYSTQSLTKLLTEVGYSIHKTRTDCFRFRICVIAKK